MTMGGPSRYGSTYDGNGSVPVVTGTPFYDNEYRVNTPSIPAITGAHDPALGIAEAAPLIIHNDVDKEATPVCRDLPFGILFVLHLLVMLWMGISVAPQGYDRIDINITEIEREIIAAQDDDNISLQDLQKAEAFIEQAAQYIQIYPERILFNIIIPCCLFGFLVAYTVTVYIVHPYSKFLVYASLVGSLAFTAIVTISSAIASGSIMGYITTGLALSAVGYYIKYAWSMVPFAAVNLKVALEGLSSNCGMYIIACLFAEIGFWWVIYWLYTIVGVSILEHDKCMQDHPELQGNEFMDANGDCAMPSFYALGMLLSLYWTNTVIMNAMQVTVSGVMATWCFDKNEANNCCSSAVYASFYRSFTYSFGSICLGSLLQAIVSVLRVIVETAKNQRLQNNNNEGTVCGSLLLCLLECISRMLEEVIEYFNQWAYVFVGIYGYSYVESGRRVIELFRARGWTSIITNNLVGYVLSFMNIVIATITGFFAVLAENIITKKMLSGINNNSNIESFVFGPVPGYRYWAFGCGFIVGLWVSMVMTNVIRGAVNALIVCWADSPAVMEANHAELTNELASEWTKVFPDEASTTVRPATYNNVVL